MPCGESAAPPEVDEHRQPALALAEGTPATRQRALTLGLAPDGWMRAVQTLSPKDADRRRRDCRNGPPPRLSARMAGRILPLPSECMRARSSPPDCAPAPKPRRHAPTPPPPPPGGPGTPIRCLVPAFALPFPVLVVLVNVCPPRHAPVEQHGRHVTYVDRKDFGGSQRT